MPATSIGFQFTNGYLGQVVATTLQETTALSSLITTAGVHGSGSTINFGDIVVLTTAVDSVAGNALSAAAVLAAGGTVTAAAIAGIAKREVKQFTQYLDQDGVAGYAPGDPTDVLLCGAVNVACLVGTPIKGGQVYVRIALNEAIPAGVLGGVEAAADGSNTIVWTNVKFFKGGVDANNVVPIKLLQSNF